MQTDASKPTLERSFDNEAARSSSDRVRRELHVPGAPAVDASPPEAVNLGMEQWHAGIYGPHAALS